MRFSIIAGSMGMLVSLSGHAASEDTLHWYRCNTHTHTSARPGSDANETPELVAEWYRSHGYQCLVITDHEYLTDIEPLRRKYASDGGFLVLQGQEITQALTDTAHPNGRREFHVNGINTGKPIMPLGYPNPARDIEPRELYKRNIDAIYDAGGLPQVNHPNLQWSVRLEDLAPITRPFLFEVWNAFPTSNNLGGVDDAGHASPSTEALWDALLSQGKVVWGVASDDTHEYHKPEDRESPTPGKAWIVVRAPTLTEPAILEALRNGQFYSSTGVVLSSYSADSQAITIRLERTRQWNVVAKENARYVTRFIGENGEVLAHVTGTTPQYRFKGNERYVRASIIDSDGRKAWTQPVFRQARGSVGGKSSP